MPYKPLTLLGMENQSTTESADLEVFQDQETWLGLAAGPEVIILSAWYKPGSPSMY